MSLLRLAAVAAITSSTLVVAATQDVTVTRTAVKTHYVCPCETSYVSPFAGPTFIGTTTTSTIVVTPVTSSTIDADGTSTTSAARHTGWGEWSTSSSVDPVDTSTIDPVKTSTTSTTTHPGWGEWSTSSSVDPVATSTIDPVGTSTTSTSTHNGWGEWPSSSSVDPIATSTIDPVGTSTTSDTTSATWGEWRSRSSADPVTSNTVDDVQTSTASTSSSSSVDPATSWADWNRTHTHSHPTAAPTSLSTTSLSVASSSTSSLPILSINTTTSLNSSVIAAETPFAISVTLQLNVTKRSTSSLGFLNDDAVLVSNISASVAFSITAEGALELFVQKLPVGTPLAMDHAALQVFAVDDALLRETAPWSATTAGLTYPGASFCVRTVDNVLVMSFVGAVDGCTPALLTPITDPTAFSLTALISLDSTIPINLNTTEPPSTTGPSTNTTGPHNNFQPPSSNTTGSWPMHNTTWHHNSSSVFGTNTTWPLFNISTSPFLSNNTLSVNNTLQVFSNFSRPLFNTTEVVHLVYGSPR